MPVISMSVRQAVARWHERWFPPKTLGERGEAAALKYLRRRGYKILARGDCVSRGELDLVALDRRTIVFVEVKTRQSHDTGHPAEAVDEEKQRRLSDLAVGFLKRYRLLDYPALRRHRHHLAGSQAAAHDRAHQERLRGGRPSRILLRTRGAVGNGLAPFRRQRIHLQRQKCRQRRPLTGLDEQIR